MIQPFEAHIDDTEVAKIIPNVVGVEIFRLKRGDCQMKIHAEYTLSTGQIIRIGQGDLTAESVDAIVNAANERLSHGGGVAGAIRRKGGGAIQSESNDWVRKHGRVPTGTAALTGAGKLPAKYVIHAVGPVWGSGDDERKLASAVRSALELAAENGVRSLAIPGISSGIFGGPKDVCARTIIRAAVDYLQNNPASSVCNVHFCNIDTETVTAFESQAREIFSTEG